MRGDWLHEIAGAQLRSFATQHKIIEARQDHDRHVPIPVACDDCQLQTIERTETDVGYQGAEVFCQEFLAGRLEGLAGNDGSTGVLERVPEAG